MPDSLGIPQLGDLSVLGYGGFSTVFLAHHAGLGRSVAVKVVTKIVDPKHRAEFDRECAAMGRLSDHPHVVVPLNGGVTAHGDSYLLLEYYPRGSVGDLVRSQGPLPQEAAIACLLQVGGALVTAHQRGVIHNDVKPENILVKGSEQQPHFSVTDFGLAQLLDGHTLQNASAGSLLFVAPEVLDGHKPTEACDVYGLAATLHFMLSGSPPIGRIDGESWISVMRRIAEERPEAAAFDTLPPILARALHQSLEKDPACRPPLPGLLRAPLAEGVPMSDPVILAPGWSPTPGRSRVAQVGPTGSTVAPTCTGTGYAPRGTPERSQQDASIEPARSVSVAKMAAGLLLLFALAVLVGRLIS